MWTNCGGSAASHSTSPVLTPSRGLHVRQRANLWGEIGAPKSAAGAREIPMAPLVVNVLREWRLKCPRDGAGRLGLTFPNGVGRVESHANILNRGWYPL